MSPSSKGTKERTSRSHAADLRGASRLVVDATKRVTDVVEGMHVTIAGGPDLLGRPLEVPVRAITGLVYGSIRGVTHVVGASIDAVLAASERLLGSSAPGPERAAVLAALNGVIGDYLTETGNPLAITMGLVHDGQVLEIEPAPLRAAIPDAGGKVLVLVHGSSMDESAWSDHGGALARDLGATPLYLRYNSGLHISTNGRAFAELLERLVVAWPVPVTEIVLVAHSMGGLVTRSACHAAEEAGHLWRTKLTKLACLGSPHHGSPLERGGNMIDRALGISRYSAPLARLGKLRSAGVTDMRHGFVLDAHWTGRDRFAHADDCRERVALPEGVDCFAIAATMTPAPRKRLRGDGLVPVSSALGRHEKEELALGFTDKWIGYGMGHLDLLSHPDVYAKLRSWLGAGERDAAT
jgi:pimeloyl-ACP methyl ester carboxylesterase